MPVTSNLYPFEVFKAKLDKNKLISRKVAKFSPIWINDSHSQFLFDSQLIFDKEVSKWFTSVSFRIRSYIEPFQTIFTIMLHEYIYIVLVGMFLMEWILRSLCDMRFNYIQHPFFYYTKFLPQNINNKNLI